MAARYEHFQSATHITVSFFAKGADRAASAVTLSPCGTELRARLVAPGGAPLLSLDVPLLLPAAGVAVSFTSMRCEARVEKRAPGMWAALELAPGAVRAAPPAAAPAPALVASGAAASGAAAAAAAATANGDGGGGSGSGEAGAPLSAAAPPPPQPPARAAKNWSQVEKEFDAEEAAAKPEGEEALMKLFQSIYKDASEDTRKAMVKSFQTSGGTVLSTNWSEVKETDYEKKAREEREGKGAAASAEGSVGGGGGAE